MVLVVVYARSRVVYSTSHMPDPQRVAVGNPVLTNQKKSVELLLVTGRVRAMAVPEFEAFLQRELLQVHGLAVDVAQRTEVILRSLVVSESTEQQGLQSEPSFMVSQGFRERSVRFVGTRTHSEAISSSSEDDGLRLDSKEWERSDAVASRITAGLRKQTMIKDFHSHTTRFDKWVHRLGLRMKGRSTSGHCFLGAWPKRVLQSGPFEAVISIIILLNVILIGLSSDYDVQCSVMDKLCDSEVREESLLEHLTRKTATHTNQTKVATH